MATVDISPGIGLGLIVMTTWLPAVRCVSRIFRSWLTRLCGYFGSCISSSRHVSNFPVPDSQWCFYDIGCFACPFSVSVHPQCFCLRSPAYRAYGQSDVHEALDTFKQTLRRQANHQTERVAA
ncbi:hypothetical protein B0H65DRAFT_98790 [Neurospora tetraspora]|uniref:Uncharacterized protein n=1 Tax=Neurospora tetraspora TaxID=94610 RepID=A0AAE0MTV6_9PEZI|nr:hypothetical protein B0H65DRAFT_98790 [Neurospora tetraspora]